jgi:hypothetical protein
MRGTTAVADGRRRRRGPVWPSGGHLGPPVPPIAPILSRPLPFLVLTTHGVGDWTRNRARHQGGTGVQSP